MQSIKDRYALVEELKKGVYTNLFLINIDNFSNINKLYGFENGDKILSEVVRLINISKPRISKLYSVGADEFAVICFEDISPEILSEMASSIVSFFDQIELQVDSISIRISISIGIASGVGVEILNHAKEALAELREHSRGAFKIYDINSAYIKQQIQNNYWIDKIKTSFENEALFTYYQPILNNNTQKIEKYECLARIYDDGIIVPPIRFLEASKLTGTLSLITRTMIENSFQAFSGSDFGFSINITQVDLFLGYLEDFLLKHAKKHNIDPSNVTLEILEDVSSIGSSEILHQLSSLREAGFKIAIDDFGSMSSNLSRLLEFSPDFLKIDGSFIKNILNDKKSLIIVESIIYLCKRSGIKTIAEFVHSKEVQDKVIELGIDYSQGYYIGEPKDRYKN